MVASEYVAQPLRSSEPAVDVEGFFRVVGAALTDYLDKFAIAPQDRPLYTEEWPKERLATPGAPFDFIGFHVVRTQRASESNTEYRPANGLRVIREYSQSDVSGYLNQDVGWKEEAVVQFTIFSQSNARATAVMKWFVGLVLYYAHTNYFRAHGVNYLVFQGRLEDTVEKTQNQDLYTRRVQFRIHVQNIFNLEAKTIETFRASIGLKDGTEAVSVSVSS